jgi:hypothetical protein
MSTEHKPLQIREDKIIKAIAQNPSQDPCVTIEGEVVQTGRQHLDLILTEIDMVQSGIIQRTKEGEWQVIPQIITSSEA